MKTIHDLVHAVQETLAQEEIFLAPADVGHVVSLFLEGLVHNGPSPANEELQRIADECGAVQ